MKSIKEIKSTVGKNHYCRVVYNSLRECMLYSRFYHWSLTKSIQESSCVFMIDGRLHHGGLADRFRGICIYFALCKIKKVPFYVNYVYPFKLEDFLMPNLYNWRINENDISYNVRNAYLQVSLGDEIYFKSFKQNKQMHVYSNLGNLTDLNKKFNTSYTYKSLFEELFKPSEFLASKLKIIKNEIGGQYIGVSFRFQHLLGDILEGRYPVLNEEKKSLLIKSCMDKLNQICDENKEYKVLVTTDSNTFLSILKNNSRIYLIQGSIAHVDVTNDAGKDVYTKEFLDFYMLRGAVKIYNIGGGGLKLSGFPMFAANSSNIPFEKVYI